MTDCFLDRLLGVAVLEFGSVDCDGESLNGSSSKGSTADRCRLVDLEPDSESPLERFEDGGVANFLLRDC